MKRNRKNRSDASLREELRRMENPLCMFNGISCVGKVVEIPQIARSFGEHFDTVALLCEYHAEQQKRTHAPKSKPAPVNQYKLPL